jgi:tetratricopeptide (TPR) repeat protein
MSDRPEAEEEEAYRAYTELRERAGESLEQCRFQSAYRLYGEMRRHCRDRGIAEGYIVGTFHQMDTAQNVLEFSVMRERAVELIALLEDDQRLLRVQGDFPREHFEYFVRTMSTCAYENLAEATGQLDGFNSDGLHACIADGLRVCRTTGKLRCVNCFREYACDVYLAADDAEIAGHQCRLVVDHTGPWTDRGDRRWLALGKLAWVNALSGRVDEALGMVDEALELTQAEGVTLKLESRLRTMILRDTIRITAGLDPELDNDRAGVEAPGADEYPTLDMARSWNRALLDAREGRHDAARAVLETWDKQLTQRGASHHWFENRLRLVALERLAGQADRARSLAQPLEKKAIQSNDFLTLRRLREVLESDGPSPLGMAPPRRGRTSVPESMPPEEGLGPVKVSGPDDAAAGPETTVAEAREERDTPLKEFLEAFAEKLRAWAEEPDEERITPLRDELLSLDRARVTHPDDAASLMHLMGFLVTGAENGAEIWDWANALSAAHRDDPGVLSHLGTIGDMLRESPASGMSERIPVERTEPLFRRSLELDLTRAGNYMRAGDHFLRRDMAGDAERCYARAFRLKRAEGTIARRLADLYARTDRPRDALHVLDVCLREGTDDLDVAHAAAMQSFTLGDWSATLTYLDRFAEGAGERPWTNYYRALCHYETGAYAAALEAVEAEIRIVEDTPWHLELILGLCRARLGGAAQARGHLDTALATPLAAFPFLSPLGMLELWERARRVATEVLCDEPLTARVEARQLRSGLMPEHWFEMLREASPEEPAEEVFLFRCAVRQPLDDTWDADADRLPHQEGWTSYIAEWGVLAETEADALSRAVGFQTQCHDLPPEGLGAEREQGPFQDKPGVVWQGGRHLEANGEGTSPEEDEFA